MRDIKNFLKKFYSPNSTVRRKIEITPHLRQKVKRYIKFIKMIYNRNWRGLRLKSVKKERRLNRLEEQLANLF